MAPATRYVRARKFLIGATVASLLAYAFLAFLATNQFYLHTSEDEETKARLAASTLGRVIDADIRSVVLSIEPITRLIASRNDLISMPDATEALERIEDDHPVIDQIALIGSDGMSANRSELLPSGETDFRERGYFSHHESVPGDDIFFDGPFDGRLMSHPYMTVSQRIENPAGAFLGVVVVAIDLNSYGTSLFRLGGIDRIAIYTDDGTPMLRHPADLQGISFDTFQPVAEQLVEQNAGVFRAESTADAGGEYVGFSRVGDYPLVVTASIPEWQATALWQESLVVDGLRFLIVVVGAGALAGFALAGLRRERSVEEKYGEDHAALQASERRRRSLLDALPANAALVDSDGTVLEVNAQWQQFSQVVKSEKTAHGSNYLAVCEAAAGMGDEDAPRVASGLRAILSATSERFEMDYPCHSPNIRLWYHLTLSPIDLGGRRGAVAMHFDVTERKLLELSLDEEQQRLRRLTEDVPGAVFRVALDIDGAVRWSFLSDRSRELFGLSSRDALEGDLLANVLSPEQHPAVAAAVEEHLRSGNDLDHEFRVRRPDGQVKFVRAVAVVGDGQGSRHSDGIFLDITAEREATYGLAYLSTHDLLTGLLNRTEFLRRVDHALQEPQGPRGDLAVLVVGIDDFGDIGDAYGMETGDAVLRVVAERIADAVAHDEGIAIARLSSERYGVLLRSADVTAPATLAESILARVGEPVEIPGNTISCSASIGLARPEPDTASATALVTSAERALRRARSLGRGTFRFDEANSGLETQTRLAMRSGLARALENREFVLHYQPRVRLEDAVVTGCEALLRWQHPVFGMQPPAKFIPIAEHSGQIVPIGKWVLQEACRQAKEWLDAGYADFRIAVNVSAVQVMQSDIVATVEQVLAETGLPAKALELEMTEAVAFDVSLRDRLESIHALGVSIAIDDFGTGFSSLGTLRSFPLDILKIDQSFVRNAPEVSADRVVVATVVDLARGLDLTTIAEGVETIEQALMLQTLGCDEIQGYYIAMPMEAADFRWFLEGGSERARRKLQPLYTKTPLLVGKDGL